LQTVREPNNVDEGITKTAVQVSNVTPCQRATATGRTARSRDLHQARGCNHPGQRDRETCQHPDRVPTPMESRGICNVH